MPNATYQPFNVAKTIYPGQHFKITTPDGEVIFLRIKEVGQGSDSDADGIIDTYTLEGTSGVNTQYFTVVADSHNFSYKLDWHNCFSFGNGVESNRIRDIYNESTIAPGVKASTVFEDYKHENNTNSLIFSGIYNSISSVNNLNQFIQAEKITKELNPSYGSIQKLHTRDTDLIALCEDKVLKILANKDAVYNADGNAQLTANINVLGQAVPFVGEYGISKNPESFVSEAYRSYFTDKQRGVVLRLSKDGLTPISSHGMKDWFKDNLRQNDILVGSYDDQKDEYNLTLENTTENIAKSVSFKENVKGWTGFKSFVPESGLSCSGNYYTAKEGKLYKHHDESSENNTFYGVFEPSTFNVLLNDAPSRTKTFHTIDYEGSQSKIVANTDPSIDDSYYNLKDKKGWHVESLTTDKQKGYINEFVEKEGKWFNYIKGVEEDINTETDFGSSNIQGLGILLSTPEIDETDDLGVVTALDDLTLELSSMSFSLQTGDSIYYVKSSNLTNNVDPANIVKYGVVKNIQGNNIIIEQANYVLNAPELEKNDFIMFAKNKLINNSSISGYYADVKFANDSREHAELFAVSSEISESSK